MYNFGITDNDRLIYILLLILTIIYSDLYKQNSLNEWRILQYTEIQNHLTSSQLLLNDENRIHKSGIKNLVENNDGDYCN